MLGHTIVAGFRLRIGVLRWTLLISEGDDWRWIRRLAERTESRLKLGFVIVAICWGLEGRFLRWWRRRRGWWRWTNIIDVIRRRRENRRRVVLLILQWVRRWMMWDIVVDRSINIIDVIG